MGHYWIILKTTTLDRVKKGCRRRLERIAPTVLVLVCCSLVVLCGGCTDINLYSTKVTLTVEQFPVPLAAISFAIDSYQLEWRDSNGERRRKRIQSIDDLPSIDIALYKPSVITLTPIHSAGYQFPPAGIYLDHSAQQHTSVELSWSHGCAIAYLQELSFRLSDFERFNGERFLHEVYVRSGGNSCFIESRAVIAKAATYVMRSTYITLQKHYTHSITISSGTWYFLDYTLPPLEVEQLEDVIEVVLPIGTYVLIQATGEQMILTITASAAYLN